MKPVYQTKFGKQGNCFVACVASILECEITDLPDLDETPEGRNWLEWLNSALAPKGVSVASCEASAKNPLYAYIPAGTYFIASGAGPRYLRHSVVLRSDTIEEGVPIHEFVHDPFLGGKGIDEIDNICVVLFTAPVDHSTTVRAAVGAEHARLVAHFEKLAADARSSFCPSFAATYQTAADEIRRACGEQEAAKK